MYHEDTVEFYLGRVSPCFTIIGLEMCTILWEEGAIRPSR